MSSRVASKSGASSPPLESRGHADSLRSLPIRPVVVESSPVRQELAARGEGGPTSLERHTRISAGCRDDQAARSKCCGEDILCFFFAMNQMNLAQSRGLRANALNPAE